MIILSLRRHFPARWPEWFMAGMAFSWGVYVSLHPQLFTHPGSRQMFSAMAAMAHGFAPSAVWGLGATITGLIRAAALFVNGAYTRTPMIRLSLSFISAFIWTQVAVGFLKSGVPNTGMVVYSGLVVLDIVSAYRAATDTVFAEKVRHDLKQDLSRVERSVIA